MMGVAREDCKVPAAAVWEDHCMQTLAVLYQLLTIRKRQLGSTHDASGSTLKQLWYA